MTASTDQPEDLGPEPAVLTGALVGYARVSTAGQLLDRQQLALSEAGCIRVFADKLSGRTADRPELTACLAYLRPGDTLVVPSLDRLSRSLADLITLVAELRRRGVGFRSLHEALDTTTPGGRLVFHVFAALAEFIRELIVQGTREGLDAARGRGVRLGRPPALSAEQVRQARDLLTHPANTVASIARLLGVSRSTLYAHLPELAGGRPAAGVVPGDQVDVDDRSTAAAVAGRTARAAVVAAAPARTLTVVPVAESVVGEWPATAAAAAGTGGVHQLRVSLLDVEPVVWRRLQVPSATTLAQLHEVLQAAMGWQQLHLHSFAWGRYGDQDGAETSVTVAEALPAAGATMGYVYDFGDHWVHEVTAEKILTRPGRGVVYPRCVSGRRTCPPEDSGGPLGYQAMLRALRARKGLAYQEAREHLGGSRFDTDAFDLAAVNTELATRLPAASSPTPTTG